MVPPKSDTAPDLIYILGMMSSDFRAEVVRRALVWRKKARGDLRNFFHSVLRKNVKIDGFRDALKADNQLLLIEILRLLPFSSELIGPVLQIWIDSHSKLQDEVYGHLSDLNLPTHGLDFSQNRFAGSWNFDTWQQEREDFVASHSNFNEDDVALMLLCVSGNMPDNGEGSEDDLTESQSEAFFPQWLEELRELPADAPQWQQANDFLASATEIIKYKTSVRSYTLKYNEILAEMKQELGRELAFFQFEPDAWPMERLSDRLPGKELAAPEDMAELLRQTESLKVLLTDYQPLYHIAPTIEEEAALLPQRAELQKQILGCLFRICKMFSNSDEMDEDLAALAKREASPVPESTLPPCEEQDGSAQIDSAQPDAQSSSAEVPKSPPISTVTPSSEELVSDASAVEDFESDSAHPSLHARSEKTVHKCSVESPYVTAPDNTSLESENSSLRLEVRELQGELKTTQGVVKLWRVAYEETRRKVAPTEEPPSVDELLPIENVRTAVALAREKHAGELLFQPNSKSEIEENPFKKPAKVMAALEWLATTYYRSKMGEVSVPDLNWSIKKACGWRYTGNQNENTMKQYKPWYTTSLEGKIYWLKTHVGTGSNKDSRYTIRIAFDWDSVRKVVVIGYIGQHQQTSAT